MAYLSRSSSTNYLDTFVGSGTACVVEAAPDGATFGTLWGTKGEPRVSSLAAIVVDGHGAPQTAGAASLARMAGLYSKPFFDIHENEVPKMFEQLFERSHVLTRQRSAPLAGVYCSVCRKS